VQKLFGIVEVYASFLLVGRCIFYLFLFACLFFFNFFFFYVHLFRVKIKVISIKCIHSWVVQVHLRLIDSFVVCVNGTSDAVMYSVCVRSWKNTWLDISERLSWELTRETCVHSAVVSRSVNDVKVASFSRLSIILPERDYTLRWGLCCRKSVCLSSVTFVHPTRGWSFRQYFFAIVYLSHALTSVQNFMEIIPGGTPPSWALNARGVAKESDGGPIEGYIS